MGSAAHWVPISIGQGSFAIAMMMRCLVMVGVSSVLLGCGGICAELTGLYEKGASCEGDDVTTCCTDVAAEMTTWAVDNVDKADEATECAKDEDLIAAALKHATACR